MEFVTGLIIGILMVYTRWSNRKTALPVDVLPRYITAANRMSILYNRMGSITTEFANIINVYGQNLSPEARMYFNDAVEKMNAFYSDVIEGWNDMKLVSEEMESFFGVMEGK